MEKLFTKENIVIIALVFYTIIQSGYFATKLDVANLKLEMQQYSDNNDKELQTQLTEQYKIIIDKIDKIKR